MNIDSLWKIAKNIYLHVSFENYRFQKLVKQRKQITAKKYNDKNNEQGYWVKDYHLTNDFVHH